jgi:hypothetical protein
MEYSIAWDSTWTFLLSFDSVLAFCYRRLLCLSRLLVGDGPVEDALAHCRLTGCVLWILVWLAQGR